MLLLALALGVSACNSVGPRIDPSACSGKAIRLTQKEIAGLSDEALADIYDHNEVGAKAGCYVPNRRH